MTRQSLAQYLTLVMGGMGGIALLAELSKRAVPDWIAVGLVILPMVLFVFADREDGRRSHPAIPLLAGASIGYILLNAALTIKQAGWSDLP